MRLSFIILCAAIGSVGAIPSGQETGYYEELLPRKGCSGSRLPEDTCSGKSYGKYNSFHNWWVQINIPAGRESN